MNLSAGGSIWLADIFRVLGNGKHSELGMLPEHSNRIQSSVEPEHSTRASGLRATRRRFGYLWETLCFSRANTIPPL